VSILFPLLLAIRGFRRLEVEAVADPMRPFYPVARHMPANMRLSMNFPGYIHPKPVFDDMVV